MDKETIFKAIDGDQELFETYKSFALGILPIERDEEFINMINESRNTNDINKILLKKLVFEKFRNMGW